MRVPRRPSVLLGCLALLVLAGCSADDTSPEGPAPADEQAPTDEAEDRSAPEPPAASDEDLEDLDLAEVRELLAETADRPAQVTYEVEGEFGLDGPTTMTIAQDPPRFATLVEAEGAGILTVVDDAGTVTCFSESGTWQCLRASGAPEGDPLDELPNIDDLDLDDEPDGIARETIVGRSAICLAFERMDEVTDAVVCFDEDTGAMLRSYGTDSEGRRFGLEAVSFDTPDPSIFDLPAEPIDLEGLDLGDLGLEDLLDQG